MFDKTGTLTEDGLSVECIHAATTELIGNKDDSIGKPIFSEPIKDCLFPSDTEEADEPNECHIKRSCATCHNLSKFTYQSYLFKFSKS